MDYATNLEGGTLIPVPANKRIVNKYSGDKDPSAPKITPNFDEEFNREFTCPTRF